MMTPEQARECLLFHSGAHPNTDDPRWSNGFVGMLRPYGGLREENFHEVMACLRALEPELREKELSRELVSALWSICHLGRAWGVWPEGMLQQNDLIRTEDAKRLEGWIDQISATVFWLLEGADSETAFHDYDQSKNAQPTA